MEHAMPTAHPYPPRQTPSYFDGFDSFFQNAHPTYDADMGIQMLNRLLSQKNYLDDLLSKTAIKLNALRERQTRNEWALSLHPTPRAKRKKIQQNRWRTSKTITTCENEERVILDCLQVCTRNIRTLEAILNPLDLSLTAVECTPSHSDAISPDPTNFGWDGWNDEAPISPFAKKRERSLPMDEVPPETQVEEAGFEKAFCRRPPPLPPRSARTPEAEASVGPPNTASSEFAHSSLSAEAVAFEPSVIHVPQGMDEMAARVDKLSISGLLSSKRMKLLQRHRFSDVAIGHMFRRLSSEDRPLPPRSHRSRASSTPQRQMLAEQLGRAWAKSTTSV